MLSSQTNFTLVNPQNGNIAFKLFSFEGNSYFDRIQRLNYFSLIWITDGKGDLKVDFSEYSFGKNSLFAFAPYQPFTITGSEDMKGRVIHFHSDFFCVLKHHKEVEVNGILFNNVYNPPVTLIDNESAIKLADVLAQMETEMQRPELAQYELLVSWLKIFLITVTRLKISQQPDIEISSASKEPFILQNLKDAIEEHFRTKHSASNYADLLNISAKALAKITKAHFNKTLTELISERIIIEAKRELYLTNKPV